MSILGVTSLTAIGSIFMAVNFHLANGGNHPWVKPQGGFDETVDLDAMLVMVHSAYIVFSGYLLVKIRRKHQAKAVPAGEDPPQAPGKGSSRQGSTRRHPDAVLNLNRILPTEAAACTRRAQHCPRAWNARLDEVLTKATVES